MSLRELAVLETVFAVPILMLTFIMILILMFMLLSKRLVVNWSSSLIIREGLRLVLFNI